MTDTGDVYEAVRRRFIATARGAGVAGLARLVPATPVWTVRDVIAHVVGLAADLNAANLPTPADADAWTRAQVSARSGRSLDALVAEWDREAPVFEDGLRLFGYETGAHFTADLHCHHQDVREALGLAADDDPLAVRVSLDHYLGFLHEQLSQQAQGSVEVVADGEARTLGAGPLLATVRAGNFDLLRSFSARRSLRQIRELDWTGDVDRALSLIGSSYTAGYSFPGD
jgi:uncharacterized protein (TIGR03083 family)